MSDPVTCIENGEYITVPYDEYWTPDMLASVAPVISTPMEISDRQFFQQLSIAGLITQTEALDAVGPGTIPAAMEALVEQLPVEQQFPARMLIRGATIYRRDNPIAGLIRQLYGWSETDADDFWRAASAL